jgi:hypothetical protein
MKWVNEGWEQRDGEPTLVLGRGREIVGIGMERDDVLDEHGKMLVELAARVAHTVKSGVRVGVPIVLVDDEGILCVVRLPFFLFFSDVL